MALKKQKPITIAEWRRNRKERIRISLCVYQGRNVIDLRTWWTDEIGEERAGRHGITLDVSHTPKLAKGFKRALVQARKAGLIDQK
jgi:hypothetical protein